MRFVFAQTEQRKRKLKGDIYFRNSTSNNLCRQAKNDAV